MKSVKRIIITLLVLTLVMIGCFVSGGVLVAKGTIDMVQSIDLEQVFSGTDIREWADTMIKYVEYYANGELVTYNSEYVSMPYSAVYGDPLWAVDTIVIEDVNFDINVKEAFRSDIAVTFKGKYPSSVSGEPLSFDLSSDGTTLTIKGSDEDIIYKSGIGTATVNIPDTFNKTVIIKNCVGDMEISGLTVEGLTVKNFAGEISGETITADKISINSFTGDAEIGGAFGSYDIENCVGELVFDSSEAPSGDSSVKNCIGELKFELPEGTSVYLLKDNSIAAVDGDIKIDAMGAQFEIENFVGEVRFDED